MLGNVTEACPQWDISRTQLYEFKRHFQTHGLEDLSPNHNLLISLFGQDCKLPYLHQPFATPE
jgi:hypothetical protein